MNGLRSKHLQPWQLIRTNWWIRRGYLGFALWPFIFLRKQGVAERHIRHEHIHLRQQLEMGILPFFLWYGAELIIRRCQYPSWMEAYKNISFEREAYGMECDEEYLSQRTLWAWWSWI